MRSLRSILCVLTAVVLLMSISPIGAGATAGIKEESNLTFKDNSDFIQDYETFENGMRIYCASMGELPSVNAFQVKLGNETVTITDIGTTKDEPTTYYCLVDVSGSLSSLQLLCAKQMLHGLCDSLSEGDQMVIATVGNEVKASDYLREPEAIGKKIDQIATTNEDTNLYRAITDSLEELDTGKDVTDRKCLVVFTDGDDDSTAETGRTQQEAERKITETRIPVYCMFPPSDKKDAGKTLGSFARISAGGEAYYLADRTLTETQIGQAIAADMKGDLILTVDLTGFVPQKDEVLLTIGYTDKSGVTYGDSINIVSSNLQLTAPVAPGESDKTGSSSEDAVLSSPEPEDEPEESKLSADKIILAGVCVGIIAIILTIYILRKKRLKQVIDIPIDPEPDITPIDTDPGFEPYQVTEPVGRAIRFTTVGNQSFSIDLSLQEGKKVTFGRNSKANNILNRDDPKLSGEHFALLLQGDVLQIWDVGSTNGTSVNGVPLVGNSVQIHSGETITAGSYQYRVQF